MVVRHSEPYETDAMGTGEAPADHPASDPLDDVFGAGDDASPGPDGPRPRRPDAARAPDAPHSHPSDLVRLRQQHVTAGYRDGVTAAKADSIQAGFDEGFGLGAAVGARAGELLGLLEGLARARPGPAAAPAAAALLADAARDLGVRAVFAPEYWAADGTWRYEVRAAAGAAGGGDDVVFADVADAHPLIRKWAGIVDDEVRKWGIDRAVLSIADEEREGREGLPSGKSTVVAPSTPAEALDW